MASEGSMQASRGGKQSVFLPSYNAYEPQQQPAWYNLKGAIMPSLPWL